MKLNLRLEFLSGESKEVECLAADLVKFEAEFNMSISRIEDDMKITHLLFLAWASEKRTKHTDKTFDEWLELVSSVGAAVTPK